MGYAEGTDVPVERSKAEIERLLTRYGASRFISGWDQDQATIAFEAHDRRVRFRVTMPELADFAMAGERRRNQEQQRSALAAETRRRWRSLCLVIKAKLEAVASGVSTFEEEFLAHVVLPNNETIGDWLAPQIAVAYASKKMPPLLPSGKG